MPMRNLDALSQKKAAMYQKMFDAFKSGEQEQFTVAFGEFCDTLTEAVTAEAKGLIQSNDNAILAGRGVRALTSGETEYYQQVIEAMRSSGPKQALASVDKAIPETVIDTVFEDLQNEHPLLNLINFQPTGALTKIIVSTTGGVAKWGSLTKAITSELSGSFAVINLTHQKVSAFIPVAKSMLDLGPAWLDRYVRAVLLEALYVALELGAVDGDGKGDGTAADDFMPIGMTRALTGAVDNVYPRKTAVVVNDLTPSTIGSILNTISQGPNGKRRNVPRLLMVVNPADYFTKVFPAVTPRTADGLYAQNALPYPMDVVVSAAVPANHAIFGLAKQYFFGIGTSQGGKLEYDDSCQFLEDNRVYLIKLYGNGRPLDGNAFVYADITNLKPTTPQVYVTNDPLEVLGIGDARLASLTIGSKTLSPAFNKSVFGYACATTDATNTITAVAMNGEATILIKNGATTVANGAAATWATGENALTVTVTLGELTETYTVIVTKS